VSSVSIIGPALNGIIPVLCVTLAGLACMLAEAFRQRGERMPIGGLGVIGLAGAAAAVVLLCSWPSPRTCS
jgi:peptidoglycan/LPS O-acetylase OafA/YrhL